MRQLPLTLLVAIVGAACLVWWVDPTTSPGTIFLAAFSALTIFVVLQLATLLYAALQKRRQKRAS